MSNNSPATVRRTLRWLACLLVVMNLAAACGDNGDDATGGSAGGDAAGSAGDAVVGDNGDDGEGSNTTAEGLGEPVEGGSITVGLEAETNSWLPGEGTFSNAGINVALTFYDSLMARDQNGELRPYLAESMKPSEDLTKWRMTLRDGVSFHDGTALTAEVIKTIFDEYLTVEGSNLAGSLSNVTEVRVDDERTVTYVLAEGNAAFPDVLRGPGGWPFSVEAARAAGDLAGSQPVGTGAFVFESWQRDDALVVTKNPDYWRDGLPYLDRITFRPIPDEDTRVQALLSGDLDAIQSLRGSAVKQVVDAAEGGRFTAHQWTGNETGASILNVLEPPLDDVRIRRALAHASDPEAAAGVLGDNGLVAPSTQWFSTDSPWWSQRVADAYPTYDVAAAEALVEEYVNDPERSDGKAVGAPPTIEYDCLPDPSLREISQLVQAGLGAIGIEVTLSSFEQAAHIANAIGSPTSDPAFRGDYTVGCWRVGDVNDPATTLSEAFGPVETQPLNFTNFTDPELDRLLATLRTTVAFDERYAVVEEIGILINENVPVTFGVGTPAVIGVREEVRNIPGWTFPDGTLGEGHASAIGRWREVWLEE